MEESKRCVTNQLIETKLTLRQQAAVKSLEVIEQAYAPGKTEADVDADAKREVNISQLAGSAQCSHIIKYRGHNVRETQDHYVSVDDLDTVKERNRKTAHLYQDFAAYGNLQQLIARHAREAR